jgi:hypothetical protein
VRLTFAPTVVVTVGVYMVSAPLTYNGYARTTQPGSMSTTLTTSVTQDLTLDFGYQLPTGLQV